MRANDPEILKYMDRWLERHERELNCIAVIPPTEDEQARIDAHRFRWAIRNVFDPHGGYTALNVLRRLRFIP